MATACIPQITFGFDTACYLPMVATVTFNDELEQYAVAAVLRPGNAPATRGARGLLRRLLAKLRAAFAGRRIGCGWTAASPARTVLGPPGSRRDRVRRGHRRAMRRLDKRARRLMGQGPDAVQGHRPDGAPVSARRATPRGAGRRKRRVIIKAEVVRHPGRDSQEQPPLRGDRPCPHAPERVYCQFDRGTGRCREPASRSCKHGAGPGPHELPALPAPTSSALLLTAGRGRLVPGAACAGPRHRPGRRRRSPPCASGC